MPSSPALSASGDPKIYARDLLFLISDNNCRIVVTQLRPTIRCLLKNDCVSNTLKYFPAASLRPWEFAIPRLWRQSGDQKDHISSPHFPIELCLSPSTLGVHYVAASTAACHCNAPVALHCAASDLRHRNNGAIRVNDKIANASDARACDQCGIFGCCPCASNPHTIR